jgi:hypothetical protein
MPSQSQHTTMPAFRRLAAPLIPFLVNLASLTFETLFGFKYSATFDAMLDLKTQHARGQIPFAKDLFFREATIEIGSNIENRLGNRSIWRHILLHNINE